MKQYYDFFFLETLLASETWVGIANTNVPTSELRKIKALQGRHVEASLRQQHCCHSTATPSDRVYVASVTHTSGIRPFMILYSTEERIPLLHRQHES